MRVSEHVVVYDATHHDSERHLWKRNGPRVAVCGDPLTPWPRHRFYDSASGEKAEVTCLDCLLRHGAMVAVLAHHDQRDLDGRPHVDHVRQVAETVGDDKLACVVAFLHDVVEDSQVTFAWLRDEHFPPDVVEAVWLLTRDEDTDNQTYLGRIGSETAGVPGRLARKVKRADAIHNLQRSRTAGDTRRVAKYEVILDAVERAMVAYGELRDDERWAG